MMQNMPPADSVARILQMPMQNVQSLLNPSNAQGRQYLAQQLVQRGASPGGGQGQGGAMQQPAGGFGQDMRSMLRQWYCF